MAEGVHYDPHNPGTFIDTSASISKRKPLNSFQFICTSIIQLQLYNNSEDGMIDWEDQGESVLNFEIKTLDFRMDPEAFELADAFSTAWTTGAGEVTADGAVLPRGVSRTSHFNIAEIRLNLLLQSLFLDDLAEVEIALEMALLLGSLVHPLLVLVLPWLALTYLEALIIIQLGHLIGVLEEILLQVPQLLLNDGSSLVLVDLANSSREAFVPASVAGLGNGARHYLQVPYIQSLIYRMLAHKYLSLLLLLTLTASKMVIQSPPELSAYFAEKYGESGIPYSIANYGIVPYGKVISGQMGTPEFLEDCLYEEIPEKARRSVLLVERNDCTFTQKSINVQKEGGKMAVIIDNKVERPEDVVMIDDGKGHSVTIPTVMVGKEDGLKMLEYMNQNPIIMVSFDLKPSPRSNVTLWVDILDHKNFIFLRTFQSYFKRIADNIDFNIAYPTSRCATNCNDNHCFYEGKYCRYAVGHGSVQNAGKEVIREQLRQYKVFQQDVNKWWDYMLRFDDSCDDLATYDECSGRILASLDIKYSTVSTKVDQSFQQEDNSLLRTFSQLKYNNSILYYPSIVINSMVYRGNLESYEVFETICESMTPMPEGCSEDAVESTHLTGWIIFGVVSVIVFVLFLVVCYRRMARRQLSMEMNKKVNELVNEYISMYEVEKFKQGETEMKNKT